MTMNEWQDLRVDSKRLWQRLEELGEIGAVHGPNGERGCARLALTDLDRQGRDLVVSWMRDLEMEVSIDAIGNVVATRAGSDPSAAAVMVGSHIDTVKTGGRFDGNLGVLAGLEIVETLAQHELVTRRPIQVAFFTDEEGSRFAPDMLGSLVYVGGLAVEAALDVLAADDGARLGDELSKIGYAGSHARARRSVPARLRRTAHRTGSRARGRGHHHRRGHRVCRASRGRRSLSSDNRRTPAPRRCTCGTTRWPSPHASFTRSARSPATSAHRRSPPSAGSTSPQIS
jgi:hypothetical protein